MEMIEWPATNGRHTVTLTKGQAMKSPVSTKHLLYGPMVLEWWSFPDGHDVKVIEGDA